MSRITVPFVQGFNNVAVGGMATTKLPRNARYFALFLQYKTNANQANIEADLTQIRLKVNSKVVRQFSAAELFKINAHLGFTFTAGMVPIWLADPRRKTPEGEEFFSWLIYEELGILDLEIEVDISGAAVAPTLTGLMAYDFQRPADQFKNPALRTVMHWVRSPIVCAAAAPVNAPLSPPNIIPAVSGWLHKLHAFDAVITQIILNQAQTPFYNVTDVQLPALIQPYGLAKQANTMHADIDYNCQYVDGLYIPSVASLNAQFVASGAAAGNQFILIQEIRKNFDPA